MLRLHLQMSLENAIDVLAPFRVHLDQVHHAQSKVAQVKVLRNLTIITEGRKLSLLLPATKCCIQTNLQITPPATRIRT